MYASKRHKLFCGKRPKSFHLVNVSLAIGKFILSLANMRILFVISDTQPNNKLQIRINKPVRICIYCK
jgi:hypothetical protein